jgi:hypothetical protein
MFFIKIRNILNFDHEPWLWKRRFSILESSCCFSQQTCSHTTMSCYLSPFVCLLMSMSVYVVYLCMFASVFLSVCVSLWPLLVCICCLFEFVIVVCMCLYTCPNVYCVCICNLSVYVYVGPNACLFCLSGLCLPMSWSTFFMSVQIYVCANACSSSCKWVCETAKLHISETESIFQLSGCLSVSLCLWFVYPNLSLSFCFSLLWLLIRLCVF